MCNKLFTISKLRGLKILGRVGTHSFLITFFSEKNNFIHFEKRIRPATPSYSLNLNLHEQPSG